MCYIVIADALIGTLMCLPCYPLKHQSFKINQKEKVELQMEVHRKTCVRDITFMVAHPPSYVNFCHFFRLLRSYVIFFFFYFPLPLVCTVLSSKKGTFELF